MAELIVIGEILAEIMAAETGQGFTGPGDLSGPYPSGAPAICIDQAARLGASCGIIACVGDDDFGALNLKRLADDGVDVSQVKVHKEKTTGVAFVAYQHDGSRKFIFHFADAASGALAPEDIHSGQFEGAKILHIMGCSLTASPSLRDAIIKGVDICAGKGIKISFDHNIRPELLKDGESRSAIDWLAGKADIILSGEREAGDLSGARAGIVIIKNGSKGARVITGGLDELIPPYQTGEVDPTGAGDCFDGAFLASLLSGKTILEAARVANAAGAFSVTRKGPMEGAATPADISRIMGAYAFQP